MKSHRSPGPARMPSKRSIAALAVFLAAVVLVFVAFALGWLPGWAAWVLHGALIGWYLTQLPTAIRDYRSSIPRLDPDYRRAKKL